MRTATPTEHSAQAPSLVYPLAAAWYTRVSRSPSSVAYGGAYAVVIHYIVWLALAQHLSPVAVRCRVLAAWSLGRARVRESLGMEWSTPSAYRVSRVVSVWWSRGLAGVFRAAQMPVFALRSVARGPV